jgi:molybdopterin-dependent oxidoreductase alpha subunit
LALFAQCARSFAWNCTCQMGFPFLGEAHCPFGKQSIASDRDMKSKPEFKEYKAPSGGWGSVQSLGRSLTRDRVPLRGTHALLKQNKPDGFACVSCAWAKPAKPHPFEFCEEGAKATTWELTAHRCTPEFFANHTVVPLEGWSDHDLEAQGRLTHPLRWDPASDKYLPVDWDEAFREIGAELKKLQPKEAVFYSSGRASLESSYMYALFARLYGNNNLPDSSNMCHESTSVALPEAIGVPVGTITLDDFAHTDCIMIFGHNTGVSSPRMLHELQPCAKRGVPIIIFNPLRERGFERFINPQNPTEMLSGKSTPISSQYHQVKTGGDTAALFGICKALIAADDAAQKTGGERVLDTAFIAEHTHGFDEFVAAVRAKSWDDLEQRSGLTRNAMEATATVYRHAKAAMGVYGMGLTQHRHGVETVQMLVNLLLLRGNLGRQGAGILPVRGHSNVQGQRTVGITEKPGLVPVEKLEAQFGFTVPKEKGLNTVEACEGIVNGSVKAMIQLGGNLVRSVPDHNEVIPAWRKLRLTVQILTKLNKSCVVHGDISYILPCLGRIEIDRQASGPQAVTMEDSTGCMHGSRGLAAPASEHLRSEPAIIAGIAKATLAPNPKVDWDGWVADYARVRDAIAESYPEIFHDFNARMWQPGGFHRPLGAKHREWKTKTGKANFMVPKSLATDIETPEEERDILQLITLRSQGQFNTTVYSYRDRFRGVEGTRMVLFMNDNDLNRLDLKPEQMVSLVTAAGDHIHRQVDGFIVRPYDIPEGCIAAYYPECNPLVPLWHHEERAKVPATKSIPVRVVTTGIGPREGNR